MERAGTESPQGPGWLQCDGGRWWRTGGVVEGGRLWQVQECLHTMLESWALSGRFLSWGVKWCGFGFRTLILASL